MAMQAGQTIAGTAKRWGLLLALVFFGGIPLLFPSVFAQVQLTKDPVDGGPPVKVITLGTTKEKVDALLGPPTFGSNVPCLGRSNYTYADGTKIEVSNGRVVSVIPGESAIRTAVSGNSGERPLQQTSAASEGPPGVNVLPPDDRAPMQAGPAGPWGNIPYTFQASLGPGLVPLDAETGPGGLVSLGHEPPCHEPLCGVITSASFGIGTWLSYGVSDSRFSGPSPIGYANPVSDLKWRNLVSESVEFNTCAVLWSKLLVSLDLGAGTISGGQFLDRDFALSNSRGVFSETLSPTLNDDLLYFNFDLGWRFYEDDSFTFEGLLGYQYWRERYIADGGAFVIPRRGGIVPPGPALTEEYMWKGLRIGGQGLLQITPCWAFKTRLVFLPLTHFENDDRHLLRELSILDQATGGFGVLLDVSVTYQIWRCFYTELGYRFWNFQSGNGRTFEHFSDGTEADLPFNRGWSQRQGLVINLTCQY